MRWTLTIAVLLIHLWASAQFSGWQSKFYGIDETRISVGFTRVVEDIHGVLWFGTDGAGLVCYNGYQWTYLQSIPGDTVGLASNSLSALLSDPGYDRVLAGTNNGMSVYEHGEWKKNALMGQAILSIEKAGSHNYWVGTDAGLVNIDIANDIVCRFLCPASGVVPYNRSENAIVSLLLDIHNPDLLWVGTQYGLKSFDINYELFTHHPNPPKWHTYHPEYAQYETMDLVFFEGKLCQGAGASGGVMCYDGVSWEQYLFKGGIPGSRYFGNYVTTIVPITDGPFVIGTTTIFGYVDFEIVEIVGLDFTETGKIGPIRDMIRTRNGLIWLAGDHGIAKLNPHYPSELELYPPIITQVMVDGEPVMVSGNGDLTVPADKVNLSIQLLSPNPITPSSIRYRWRLGDSGSEWTLPQEEGVVSFAGVAGGKYVFDFQCSNDLRSWVPGQSLMIEIRTPMYRKTWFKLLVVVLFIALIYGLVKIFSASSRKKIRLKSETERRTINAELTALRSQMNPHFIFNSLNSIYNFILGQDNERAAEYLSKFAVLMRMVLANSQAKGVSLDNELSVIRLYLELEQIRFEEKFEFEILTDLSSHPADIVIPPMLIQPYIENAIWHGFMHKDGPGSLKISIQQKSEDRLRIVIEDDGIGRERSHQYKSTGRVSYGSSITQERLASFSILYNAPFNVKIEDVLSPEGATTGTRVVLDIHMMKSYAL